MNHASRSKILLRPEMYWLILKITTKKPCLTEIKQSLESVILI